MHELPAWLVRFLARIVTGKTQTALQPGPGTSPRSAIKVKSVQEEVNFISLLQCSSCNTPLSIENIACVSDIADIDLTKWERAVASGHTPRLYDRMLVKCANGHRAELYFDINDMPEIRAMKESPYPFMMHHATELGRVLHRSSNQA